MAYNPNEPRDRVGKWTAGAAHSAAVEKVGRDSVSAKVLAVIRSNPRGFSVTPQGDVPKKGYMVAVPGHSRILSPQEFNGKNAQAIVNDYARKNAAILKEPGAHIGGWQDRKSKQVYLDVAHNIPRQRDAVKAGKSRNQIAIWDVKRRREIRTGGTGTH